MSKNNIKAYRTLEIDDISLAVLEMIKTVNAARNISTPNIEEVAAITTAVNSLMTNLRTANSIMRDMRNIMQDMRSCYDRQ
jgi:hypothetical protein